MRLPLWTPNGPKFPWYTWRTIITRTVQEDFVGFRMPWWLGYSYKDYNRAATIYYIIPLNYIVAFFRKAWNELGWDGPMRWEDREANMSAFVQSYIEERLSEMEAGGGDSARRM